MASPVSRNTTTTYPLPLHQVENVADTLTQNVMEAALKAANEISSSSTRSLDNAVHLSKEALHHEAALAGVDISDLTLDSPANISEATKRIKEGRDATLITFSQIIQKRSDIDPIYTLASILYAKGQSQADKATAIRSWIQQNQANLDKATFLAFNDQDLRAIPPEIGYFRNVEWICLRNNQITALPDSIGQLTKLKKLELEHNQITSLPESIGQLTELPILGLDHNKLTTLPASFGQLTKLEKLTLNRNQITSLPPSFSGLESLCVLYLCDNQLSEIPESVIKLRKLNWLYLDGNQITSIPDSISAMRESLMRLHLDRNMITYIPPAVWELTKLEALILSGNQLTILSEDVAQLKNLEWLYIADNRLTKLPDALGKLPQLERLYANGNRLTSIPDALKGCIKLEELYLEDNHIEEVPESLAQLSQLRKFDLGNNRITTLSEAIMRLNTEGTLFLEDNPIAYEMQRSLFENHPKLKSLMKTFASLSAVEAVNQAKAILQKNTRAVGIDISSFPLTCSGNIDDALKALNQGQKDVILTNFISLFRAQLNDDSFSDFFSDLGTQPSAETIRSYMNRYSTFNKGQFDRVTTINLSNKGLRSIPPEIFHFRKLTTLDLRGNNIYTHCEVTKTLQERGVTVMIRCKKLTLL